MESWLLRDGGAVAVQVHSRQDVSTLCTRHSWDCALYVSLNTVLCVYRIYIYVRTVLYISHVHSQLVVHQYIQNSTDNNLYFLLTDKVGLISAQY